MKPNANQESNNIKDSTLSQQESGEFELFQNEEEINQFIDQATEDLFQWIEDTETRSD